MYATDDAWAGAGVNLGLDSGSTTVAYNRVHHLGQITDGKCGIQVNTANNVVHHNVVHDVANFGISLQSYAFRDYAFRDHPQEARNNLVANNTVYNTGRQGLFLTSKGDCTTRGNRFANNIVVGSPRGWYDTPAWVMVFDTYHLTEPVTPGTWLGNVFENNVFFHRAAGEKNMVLYSHRGTAVTWSIPELEASYPETFKATREVAPAFVAPEKGDFSLEPGSPLIDSGIDVGMPYEGEAPDVGATP